MKLLHVARALGVALCVLLRGGQGVSLHGGRKGDLAVNPSFMEALKAFQQAFFPKAFAKKALAGNTTPLLMKPFSDPRHYQVTALENGMKVINIQDTQLLQSAFAVAVGAGSYDNPDEFLGLAHFCEHMLFLGNAKYPESQGFDKFVSAHGGYANAFTASEVTDYFAELSSTASEEGLERIANFFIHPNFKKQFVTQEVNAVNSEHLKNVQDAPWFVSAIMESLAMPGSPIGRFSTGDLNTLYHQPMAKGKNPVDALRTWYDKNYCPGRMRVATIGPETLEVQLDRVKKDFAGVPAGTPECNAGPNDHSKPAPWPASQMGKWVDIQGTQPQAQMWINFALPDLTMEYRSGALLYLNWVYSYGGVNSLSQVLEDDLGLTTGLSMMNDGSSVGSSFWLIATLTAEGAKVPGLVLDVIYAYTAQLKKGVNRELYQSLADKVKLDWNWTQPDEPSSTVSGLADSMMRLPLEDILWANGLITEMKPELIESLFQYIAPSNMNIAYVNINMTEYSKLSLIKTDLKVFPNYNTTYAVTDLEAKYPNAKGRWNLWLSGTVQADAIQAQLSDQLTGAGVPLKASPLATPPGAIVGVPKEVELSSMHVTGEYDKSPSVDIRLFGPQPTKYDGAEGSRDVMWVRSGWVTTCPEISLAVSMRVLSQPDEPETPAYDILRMSMYGGLLSADMERKLYDLEAMGGRYSASQSTSGMSLSFSGYKEVLPKLMEGTIAGFIKGVNETNPKVIQKFSQLVAQQKDALQTYSDMPYSYALSDRSILMQKGSYANAEMLEALSKVSLHDATNAVKDLLLPRPMTATTLGMGNLASEDAMKAVGGIVTSLREFGVKAPTAADTGVVEHVTPVLNTNIPIELRKLNPKNGDENGVAVVTVFTELADVETRVIMNLLGDIIQPVAYGYLRTTKQLGYVVNSGVSLMSNIMYLSTVVQGVAEPADSMEAHIEYVYTKLMPEALAKLPDEEYQNYKSSFIEGLMQPPKTNSEEFSHSWSHASEGGGCFGLTDEMLGFLNELNSKDRLIEFYNKLVFPTSGPRKRFAVKYFAGAVPPRPTKEETAAAWTKVGVPAAGIDLLNREYDATIMLDRADSVVRKALHEKFPYHPKDIICHRKK